jgi:hypothetical protein
MSFYSDQAAQFEQMASDIETRLTDEGSTLDDATYTSLEWQEETLQDNADTMIADDIQTTLAQLKVDEPRLAKCTASLVDAVKTVKTFDQVAALVSAAVTLAMAIASADPGAIANAVEGAEKAVVSALAKPKTAVATGTGTGLPIAASGDSTKPRS